ncbi:MAG: hypothetical protein JY451_07195 [Erythrobacter sp.]|nr:MAG: hypothetical protein JY451_07195 [Erythrobacter sp.]
MYRGIFGAVAAALLMTQAMASQKAAAQEDGAYDAYAEEFAVEPLTAEQQARMPAARRLADLAMPEGSYAELAGSTFGISPEYELEADPFGALYGALAYSSAVAEIAGAKAGQAMDILDPAWRERQEAQFAHQASYSRAMIERFEPIMRDAYAELFAIRFTQSQLQDIEAFLRTDSGAAYAREALSMATDPRVSASIYSRPELWEVPAALDYSALEATLAALPAARAFADLSARERARLAALTGMSEAELEQAMREGAEMNAAAEAAAVATDAAIDHGH